MKMSAGFYRAFDRRYLLDAANAKRTPDYRSVFHQDRDRIMFTPAFRRLQAKTQVFQAGEYDFYRTRLTHSLEVAHIAKSIAVWLQKSRRAVAVDPNLLEAICFAHDIGHPPFGHAGERVLNQIMEPYGGFEGNAQTLRILTRTIYSRASGQRGGMSPTRALLDGVLKYKRFHRDRGAEANHFIYDDQDEILHFCFGTAGLSAMAGVSDPNRFHSLECQIMDLADDIAYSCFDIVDGWKARFLAPDRLAEWREEQGASLDRRQRKYIDELLGMMANNNIQSRMNALIGKLIAGISLKPRKNFMTARTNRHAYRVHLRPEARSRIRLHKKICHDLIFGSSTLQQIEYKGGYVLRRLALSLFSNYLGETTRPAGLVPSGVHRAVLEAESKPARARLLCDYLSGMTDVYAQRSYKRLFSPGYGSISELI
ncbi:MAG TPA: dNTP triphosphohydrolase [Candidatus Methylacidiphilales bacterium]|nr:dNTP triphosphohydrolase [Candidatus Methylacidiphilales bacterium]